MTTDRLAALRDEIASMPYWDKRSVPGGKHVKLSSVLAYIDDAILAAAGVTVDPALDVERLREAAQAMVTWWDTPPYTYDDRDMIERIDALRAALVSEEKL